MVDLLAGSQIVFHYGDWEQRKAAKRRADKTMNQAQKREEDGKQRQSIMNLIYIFSSVSQALSWSPL